MVLFFVKLTFCEIVYKYNSNGGTVEWPQKLSQHQSAITDRYHRAAQPFYLLELMFSFDNASPSASLLDRDENDKCKKQLPWLLFVNIHIISCSSCCTWGNNVLINYCESLKRRFNKERIIEKKLSSFFEVKF
ncbi:hypothetical protein QVD17_04167 [Tagetes erecta]|uniref:Uncharacterized protein n=1 Tax=Tagetes erecta TaxID=13708 RepID=A0AAD8L9N2_TARER|nr:hypothetical protein QVD17_04167 [Tagetes erecta]